jgi:hypothetical protein
MRNFYKCLCFLLISLKSISGLYGQNEPSRQWLATRTGQTAYDEGHSVALRASNGDYYLIGQSGASNFVYVAKYSSSGSLLVDFKYAYPNSQYMSVSNAHLDASNNLTIIGETDVNGYAGYVVKFSTGNGSNSVIWNKTYSISNDGQTNLNIVSSQVGGISIYITGIASDTMWIAKINNTNGNLVFVKKINFFANSSPTFSSKYSDYDLRSLSIDNNQNLYLTGAVSIKSTGLFSGSSSHRRDGFVMRLDSNGTRVNISALAPLLLFRNSSVTDTSTNFAEDVVRFVRNDNSNNIYIALERKDSLNYNLNGLYLYKYTSGGTLSFGPLFIGNSGNSEYKEGGKLGGMSIVGNDLYVSYTKPNYYRPSAGSSVITEAMGMAKINGTAGTITWNTVLPQFSISPAGFPFASQTQVSPPSIDVLGSNLFMAYKRFARSLLTVQSLQVVKFNISSGSATVLQYVNPISSSSDLNVQTIVPDANGIPLIAGNLYYNTSRNYDGLILKPNTANTSVQFEDYFNIIDNASSLSYDLNYDSLGNKPLLVGQTANLSSGLDVYFSNYNPATGSSVSASIDKGNLNNSVLSTKYYRSSNLTYTLTKSSNSVIYYVDQINNTASVLQKLSEDLVGVSFTPSHLDIHNGSIYIGGKGLGGDVSIRKYTLTSGASAFVDSVGIFDPVTYSSTSIRKILYNGNFAYAVAFQDRASNSTTPDRHIFERIDLTSMNYSTWSTSNSAFSGLTNISITDMKWGANKRFFTIVYGKDTTGGVTAFKFRLSKLDTNFNTSFNTNISPSSGSSFRNAFLEFNSINGNPLVFISLTNGNVLMNEYNANTGALVSSNTYNVSPFSNNSIFDVHVNSNRDKVFIVSNYYNNQSELESIVSSIDLTTKTMDWIYHTPEVNSLLRNIVSNVDGTRLYTSGSRPVSGSSVGSEIVIHKLCDINRPLFNVPANVAFCSNNVGQISVTNYTSGLTWNGGQTTSSITPGVSGNYWVTHLTSSDGCSKVSDTVNVLLKGPINQEICFTSFDKNQNKILVYFDQLSNLGGDSVVIYRDFGANNFQRVGAVKADSTWWEDNTLGTTISQALAYKIQIRDTCGQYGTLSNFHKPVFVTSFPNVVAGANTMNFEIYQRQNFPGGLPNKYFNLMGLNSLTNLWDSVASIAAPTSPGQTSFQIVFTPSTQQLTTYGSNYRIDAKLDTGQFKCTISNFTAKMLQAKKTQGGPSHSNLRTSGLSLDRGLLNTSILTFPNPSTGQFTISANSNEELSYEVINVLGKQIYKGAFKQKVRIDLGNESSGVYLLMISDGKNTIKQELLKY